MASMVGGFFSIFAEVLLPAVAALCRDWPVLQAVATLPLLQLLSCWWCVPSMWLSVAFRPQRTCSSLKSAHVCPPQLRVDVPRVSSLAAGHQPDVSC